MQLWSFLNKKSGTGTKFFASARESFQDLSTGEIKCLR
jgi:hypothetical protein